MTPRILPLAAYEPLVSAILAAPRDPTPRFALADFLRDNGDPRGGLMRLASIAEHACQSVPVLTSRLPIGRTGFIETKMWKETDPTLRVRARWSRKSRSGWLRLLAVAYLRDMLGCFGGTTTSVRLDDRVMYSHERDPHSWMWHIALCELYTARLVHRAYGAVKGKRPLDAHQRYVPCQTGYPVSYPAPPGVPVGHPLRVVSGGERHQAIRGLAAYLDHWACTCRFLVHPSEGPVRSRTYPLHTYPLHTYGLYTRRRAGAHAFENAALTFFDHAALCVAETHQKRIAREARNDLPRNPPATAPT